MKDKNEESIVVPEKFKDIVKQIEEMSVLDLAELVKILEEKFGVSAAMPVATAPVVSDGQEGQAAQEEKTAFNVVLISGGDQKIAVIKIVRELTGKGLKEAKDLVDAAPKVVKEGVKKEEAEEIKKRFEEVGAKAELK